MRDLWADNREAGSLTHCWHEQIVTRQDFLGCPAHPDEDTAVLNLTPGRADGEVLEGGLHVDTYNDEPRRFATAILYLNTVDGPRGAPAGQTVFPLASGASEEAVAAGAALLGDLGVESTLDARPQPAADQAADRAARCSALLEEAAAMTLGPSGAGKGLAVAAREGSLLLFFTRTAEGRVDPRLYYTSLHHASIRGPSPTPGSSRFSPIHTS